MTAPTSANHFAITLEALEAGSHVPHDELVETYDPPRSVGSTEAWAEARRQATLAGGA